MSLTTVSAYETDLYENISYKCVVQNVFIYEYIYIYVYIWIFNWKSKVIQFHHFTAATSVELDKTTDICSIFSYVINGSYTKWKQKSSFFVSAEKIIIYILKNFVYCVVY